MKQIFIVAFIIIAFVSCSKEQSHISNNVVIGVDISASRDSSVQAFYRDVIANYVIRNLGMHDKVTIIAIDNGSQTATQEVFTKDFGTNNYTNEFAGFEASEMEIAWHKDSIAAAISEFNRAFSAIATARRPFDKGTDVLGGLNVGAKYYTPLGHNLLLMLSDMRQSMGLIDFEKALTKAQLETYLKSFPKAALNGFDILVLTGAQKDIDINKYHLLEEFWRVYIEGCGGKVVDYSSGSTTKLIGWINSKSYEYE